METAQQITRHSYGYTLITPLGYAEAIETVTQALKSEGFGVLTTIDVQATLRQKLGVERTPYTILGACNPSLAHRAFSAEPEIGLLLPCNVVVYVNDGGQTVVSAIDPESMFTVVHRDDLAELATEVSTRLQRALAQMPVM